MRGFKWLEYTPFCRVDPEMVLAGKDLDDSFIVVGRARHQGDILPAKAKPQHRVAYVSYDGVEHMKREFEILMSTDFRWVPSSYGSVPFKAVEGGKTKDGEELYIGRTKHRGVTCVGKVHRSHRCLYIPYNGKEISCKYYDVLVEL